MTQENKELLIKDLCARLPYSVKCEVVKRSIDGEMLFIRSNSTALELTVDNVKELVTNDMYEIKPYLFPLSSMTKEQESYLHFNTKFELDACNDLTVKIDEDDNYFYTDTYDYSSLIDWLIKNHFDYRGLIEKGLAIDATGLNIY